MKREQQAIRERNPKPCQVRSELWGRTQVALTVVFFPCDDPKGTQHQGFCRLPQGHEGAHETALTCASIRCKAGELRRMPVGLAAV